MEKFGRNQRREDQFFTLQRFSLNGCQRPRIGRVVGNGKLNEDVAIQANLSSKHFFGEFNL